MLCYYINKFYYGGKIIILLNLLWTEKRRSSGREGLPLADRPLLNKDKESDKELRESSLRDSVFFWEKRAEQKHRRKEQNGRLGGMNHETASERI